jgi:hypothetical protein
VNQLTELDYLMDTMVSKYIKGKQEILNEKKLPEDERWQKIFQHIKLKIYHLKILGQSQNFLHLCQEKLQP